MLKDFIASLPIDVIRKTQIEEQKVFLPTNVDASNFYKKYKDDIESTRGLTPEKAIYLASINKSKTKKSIPELLLNGR